MDYLEKKAILHENKKRLYPRPTFDCEDCGEQLILCWGEKVKPYLRHKANGGECSADMKIAGETYFHREAKRKLVEYLNRGGQVRYRRKCSSCHNVYAGDVPNGLHWQEEVSYNVNGYCRFDIGGGKSILREKILEGHISLGIIEKVLDGDIEFGIEIKNTHKTDNIRSRDTVPWIEIEAVSVLDELDVSCKPKCISIDSINDFCCKECTEIIPENARGSDKCYGQCFIQTSPDDYERDKDCPEGCQLKLCSRCKKGYPLWVLLSGGGICISCDMDRYTETIHQPRSSKWKECSKCHNYNVWMDSNKDICRECTVYVAQCQTPGCGRGVDETWKTKCTKCYAKQCSKGKGSGICDVSGCGRTTTKSWYPKCSMHYRRT